MLDFNSPPAPPVFYSPSLNTAPSLVYVRLLRYGLCWRGLADAIFMTFTPLQCAPSARRISPSLISIAIQMLTFKATSRSGRGGRLADKVKEWSGRLR